MNQNLTKRIALLLSVILFIGMLPVGAHAAEAHPGMITIKSGQSVGDGSYINHTKSGYPFLMTFELDENTIPLQSCRLGVYTWDCDEITNLWHREYDQVYVNDTCVGVITGQDDTWKTSYFNVPLDALRLGTNTITIYVGHEDKNTGNVVQNTDFWLLEVKWASLQFDGGKDENAPDSFKLQLTSATETATGITCTASAQIQAKETHSYVIEYSLVDLSINQIVADDEENVSGTNITSTGHFYLPSDTPRGNYRIEATLRDDITNQVYATAVYNFNLQTVLDGNCKHEAVGNREYVTTNYYKLKKDEARYAEVHQKVDTYSRMCRLCNKKFYEYVTTMEEHDLPVCICGFVQEGFNAIYSATLTPLEHSVAGGKFKVEIVTHGVVKRVTATNDVGVSLNESKWVVTDNADGTRTFSRVYTADLPAENRVWTVKAYNVNGRYLSTRNTNALKIYNKDEKIPLEAALDVQIEVVKNDIASVPSLHGPFSAANAQLTASAQVGGGSWTYTYAWSITDQNGSTSIPESTTREMKASIPYWEKRNLTVTLTVTDSVTNETITTSKTITVQCPHSTNGISTLLRQASSVYQGDKNGHTLVHVDACSICNEQIITDLGHTESHYFTSDASGLLTCSTCQYSIMPESFAEAANIVGSPAYRIYHDAVFPLHSPDGLFRSTASTVIEHRVNDTFLVFLEEAYDVLDPDDFDETETAMKKEIVYETLQDILCERADETMANAVQIKQIMDDKDSVIKEIGSFAVDEGINAGWEYLGLNGMEKAYMNMRTAPVLKAIDLIVESGKIIQASNEEMAKIAFCLALNEDTERALRIMREEMGSGYTEIIDELIEKNEKGLLSAVASQYFDAAGLIAKLGAEAFIDYGAFTVVPGLIDTIAEASHQAYLEAFRTGKSVAEVTSQMRTTAVLNQISQGANIVGSIFAGIKIGHAIGGAADQVLYAQDQLMLILPYEMTAYSNLFSAYYDQSENLYEVSCIYLETLKQGYMAAKAMYDAHDTAFARLWNSKEETEACITLSNCCQAKLKHIDQFIQLLNVERDKYDK